MDGDDRATLPPWPAVGNEKAQRRVVLGTRKGLRLSCEGHRPNMGHGEPACVPAPAPQSMGGGEVASPSGPASPVGPSATAGPSAGTASGIAPPPDEDTG